MVSHMVDFLFFLGLASIFVAIPGVLWRRPTWPATVLFIMVGVLCWCLGILFGLVAVGELLQVAG